jgi:hypothetical protein
MKWLLLGALLLTSCRMRARTPCEEACAAEARCADELELPASDSVECATRCAQLERDPEAKPLVAEHLRCVREASACKAILDCP